MAAGFFEKANLKYVMHKLYGVETDKDVALSDWRCRPLTDAQLQYGARDVLYLHAAARDMVHQLLTAPSAGSKAGASGGSECGAPENARASAPATAEEGQVAGTAPDGSTCTPLAPALLLPSSADKQAGKPAVEGERESGEERVHRAWKRSQSLAFTVFSERAFP